MTHASGAHRWADQLDDLVEGVVHEVIVEVRNENGERVLAVTVSMRVDRALAEALYGTA
jgi:hypothetical protein